MKQVALITGANRGIGLETARQLGKKDMIVLVAARSLLKAEQAVDELKADGVDAHPMQIDVVNNDDIKRAVAHIDVAYGKLDVLVNNAGIIQGESFAGNSTETIKYQDMVDTFNVNLFGVVNLTQQLLPLIKRSEAGRIVNLSSILASLTLHSEEDSPIYNSLSFAYNASKAALNQFTIHLAVTLKDTNVKVNSAHPGWVKTEMGGPNALMDITQGAATTVRLATLANDGPTGKYFHMDDELPW